MLLSRRVLGLVVAASVGGSLCSAALAQQRPGYPAGSNRQQWRGNRQQQPQQQRPPRELPKHESEGTVSGVQQGAVLMETKTGNKWVVRPMPNGAKIRYTGTAERDFLKPGLSVSFSATIDKKGAVDGELAALEVFAPQAKGGLGLFEGDKLVRGAAAGSYTVKGKVISFKSDLLVVSAGGKKISAKLAPQTDIKVNLNDTSYAAEGDSVTVTAQYLPESGPRPDRGLPGEAYAEEISVTAAKPLTGMKKTARIVGARSSKSTRPGENEPAAGGSGFRGFGDAPDKADAEKKK